jgi:hypothetical protein
LSFTKIPLSSTRIPSSFANCVPLPSHKRGESVEYHIPLEVHMHYIFHEKILQKMNLKMLKMKDLNYELLGELPTYVPSYS